MIGKYDSRKKQGNELHYFLFKIHFELLISTETASAGDMMINMIKLWMRKE